MNVLIVGQLDRKEFLPLPERITALASEPVEIRTGNDFVLLHGGGWNPDVIVVALSHPDEHSEDHAIAALAAAPLARWIVLLGEWCASALRTGLPWPHPLCVFEDEFDRRFETEREVLRGRHDPLPWTASREETVAFDLG
ncbi:MAG: hypothetical protein IT428_02510 [Planctomycetaceae bacterium]|nr:hypothetical protein [Planctomycetaceae bacterium]